MKEETYLLFRRVFYWIIVIAFVTMTPVVLYNSLGYKFDKSSKHFLKTGLISIKSFPRGARVIMKGVRLTETTPCVFRELLPRTYSVILEKEGYYPYQKEVRVSPSLVSEMDVMLVPKMKNIEKLSLDFYVYRFFIVKRFLGEMIIAFTDQGIYFLDNDFKNPRKISGVDLGSQTVATIRDLIESNNRLIFWTQDNVWVVKLPENQEALEGTEFLPFYKASRVIKNVFLGLKERYVIVHDGTAIIAVDIQNPSSFFPLYEVQSAQSEVYYQARAETIYLRDKIPGTNSFSLFRMELIPLINERQANEKTS